MINLPRDQLPAPLRRKLVFGDAEQIDALRDLAIRIEKCDVGTMNIYTGGAVDSACSRAHISSKSLAKLRTMAELVTLAADGLPENLRGLGPLLGGITRELAEVSA